MRVCLLTPVLDAFKGGNHLPLLAAVPEVQFTILTNRTKPKDPCLPPNVRVQTLPGRLGPYYYGCSDFLFARTVLRTFPVTHSFWKQFDVLHLNQTMGPALLQLKQTGVPVCLLIHHPVSADLAVAVQESRGWERLRWRIRYAPLLTFQKKFCRNVGTIATVSHTAAERIAKDYGVSAAAIRIIPNGVSTTLFTPADLATTQHDVIAVGSFIHPRKGFAYLRTAYEQLAAKGLRIADVGRRTDQQRAALQRIQGVEVFGTVEQERLLALMRGSALLISTSLYEGFGLSLIEALACGRPAFAFAGGAVEEVLGSVDPFLVVPLRDTETLVSRALAFLALSTDERMQRGEGYRMQVQQRFTEEHSATALRGLYASLGKRT